jgi:hypothetical protein
MRPQGSYEPSDKDPDSNPIERVHRLKPDPQTIKPSDFAFGWQSSGLELRARPGPLDHVRTLLGGTDCPITCPAQKTNTKTAKSPNSSMDPYRWQSLWNPDGLPTV